MRELYPQLDAERRRARGRELSMGASGLNIWEGECVRLRALRVEDSERYHLDGADSESDRLSWEIHFPRSPEGTRKWLEDLIARPTNDDNRFFAIETLDRELVGAINSHSCHRVNATFSYGLSIFRAHRRKGYARDAIRILLRYFFDEIGYQKVSAGVYDFNEASILLHEQLGFLREGLLRRNVYTAGNHHDEMVFGLTAEEFRRPVFAA